MCLDRESLTIFRIPVQAVSLRWVTPANTSPMAAERRFAMEGIFLVRASQWDLHVVFLGSRFGVWEIEGPGKKVSVWKRYRCCDLWFRCCSVQNVARAQGWSYELQTTLYRTAEKLGFGSEANGVPKTGPCLTCLSLGFNDGRLVTVGLQCPLG